MGENQLGKNKKSKYNREKRLQFQAITSIILPGRDFIFFHPSICGNNEEEKFVIVKLFTESSTLQLLNVFISSHGFLGL